MAFQYNNIYNSDLIPLFMDEVQIKKIAESGLKITIKDMLREIRRSYVPFRGARNEGWEQLEQALEDAVFEQFGMEVCVGIDWEHHVVGPVIADRVLSEKTLVPYLRCNFYCAEYLDSHRR